MISRSYGERTGKIQQEEGGLIGQGETYPCSGEQKSSAGAMTSCEREDEL